MILRHIALTHGLTKHRYWTARPVEIGRPRDFEPREPRATQTTAVGGCAMEHEAEKVVARYLNEKSARERSLLRSLMREVEG